MTEKPRIIGYGIVGPGEAKSYMRATLDEFKRLTDDAIFCLAGAGEEEKELLSEYGYSWVETTLTWGKWQWNIKEKFLTGQVSQLKPDMLVALDMDEVFDKNLTKEGLYDLYKTEFPAFYFHIVNLWDDGYNPERSFWNIRVWKWRKDLGTRFPRKNVHCGLAPEWVWARGMYVPYILKHYGLKDKEDRDRKVDRYKKYDPEAKCITKEYYKSLESYPHIEPFDEDKLHQEVVDYVNKYKQKLVEPMEKEEDLIIIKTLAGETAVVPSKQQASYEKQGCEIVGPYKEVERTLDEIINEPKQEVGGFDQPAMADEAEPEVPEETFICGDCSAKFTSAKALHGHKMGAHKKSWKYGKK